MSKRRNRPNEEEVSYWLSYSDMMAALLLVFILIIAFTMLESRKSYEDKEAIIEEQQVQLEEQQKKLDEIIGVRSELIEALKDEFAGSNLNVAVDAKTGAIAFDSSILFDVDSNDLKEEGEDFLADFIPQYCNVLLRDEYKEYISEIIIEGHTDTNGTYIHNLELSQQRAFSVAKFCLDTTSSILSGTQMDELRSYITANGRSYSNPILKSDGSVDMDASRRVEFKFRLKDDEMIDEMSRIIAE